MFDKIFGEINYEYGWNGNIIMDCFGEKKEVEIMIFGNEDDAIEPYQYRSFKCFIEKWNRNTQLKMVNDIFNYYNTLRYELGYDDNSNSKFPTLRKVDDIIKMINIDMITIPMSGIYDGRCVNLALSCSWDDENGLGIRFINEQIDEIGYQDIAF